MFPSITAQQRELIERSRIFFVASVAPDLSAGPLGQGAVNLSPKGGVPLVVVDDRTVAYLDYHGSGNETARHASVGGPVCVMVHSMEPDDAAIVRLYGHATATPFEDSALTERLLTPETRRKGLRQVVTVAIESTQTSCGYGVPVFDYVADRGKDQRGKRYRP